jgi:hypothetical protein
MEQRLALPLERVFPFFAEARNLESITPPWLHFRILNQENIVMERGATIDYRLRVHGVPFRWQSMISDWEPPCRFVDVQTKGPYRLWHHEHRFERDNGATILRDTVTYALWGSFLIQPIFVAPALERIFVYRRMRIAQIFGAAGGPST